MAQTRQARLASRIFAMGIGIVIALALYFINLKSMSLPALITVAGKDITIYALALILIAVGVVAGVLIRYGWNGGT